VQRWLFAFEAKEIQKYLLKGDKLRDMVGASELVNQFCQEFLDDTIEKLELSGSPEVIGQAAGGARLIFDSEEDAWRLYSIWQLMADRFVPGLKVVQALVPVNGSISDALQRSSECLRAAGNIPRAPLPEIGPLIDRYTRTGGAAVKYDRDEGAIIDRETFRKRQCFSELKNHPEKNSLIEKIGGLEWADSWPVEMDDISGPDREYIAVIHADGNSMGQVFSDLRVHLKSAGDRAPHILRSFSKAVEDTTVSAVKKAFEDVIFKDYLERNEPTKKWMAARPIVIGGDDITIIIRADLTFDFVEIFLEEFEISSQREIEKIAAEHGIEGLPEVFTACAGIALTKRAYPFSRGHELAESLCKFSKDSAKSRMKGSYVASCFAFHKVTTSIAGSYDIIMETELERPSGLKLWFGPYGVGKYSDELTQFARIRDLSAAISEFPRSAVNRITRSMYHNRITAQSDYRRMLQIARKRGHAELAVNMDNLLKSITVNDESPLWDQSGRTPIEEAMKLHEIHNRNKT